jgi:hypothetical protein
MAYFRQISALDFSIDTVQLLSQAILAAGVNHLLLDLGRIRGPHQLGITK